MGLVIPIILSFNSLFQIVQKTHKSQFITQSIKISNWKCYDTLLGHIVMASSTWYTATELSKKFFSIPATKAMQSSLHALETDDNSHEESWPGLRLSFPPLKYSLKRSSLDILKNILLVLFGWHHAKLMRWVRSDKYAEGFGKTHELYSVHEGHTNFREWRKKPPPKKINKS